MPTEPNSETQDLAQEYLDEDPAILTPEQIKKVQNYYKITDEAMRNILKGMTNARKNLDPKEINR